MVFFGLSFLINLILSSLFGVVVSIFARKRPTVRIAVKEVSSIRLKISTFFAKTEQKIKTCLSFQQESFDWLDNSICSTSRSSKKEMREIFQASKRFFSKIVQLKANLFTGVNNFE